MTGQSAPTEYLRTLVCDGGVSDWEREFCASLIAQQNKGREISEKQTAILERIVASFQRRAYAADDDAGDLLEPNA